MSARLALPEREIAPGAGAAIRLGACLGVPVYVVDPCGSIAAAAWARPVAEGRR